MGTPGCLLDVRANGSHLLRIQIRALQTRHMAPRRKKKIAGPHQLLGALGVQYGTRVNLRTHVIGNPGGEIRFDYPRDHIHRRSLGGYHQMDAHSTRQLGQTSDVGLHILSVRHHEVRQFVNY